MKIQTFCIIRLSSKDQFYFRTERRYFLVKNEHRFASMPVNGVTVLHWMQPAQREWSNAKLTIWCMRYIYHSNIYNRMFYRSD